MDGPEIEFQLGQFFPACQDLPWGQSTLLYNGYQVFPGGKATAAFR